MATVSLGERECSVQRRHQKVIEEAPSAVVMPSCDERMGEAACGSRNASGIYECGHGGVSGR